jgi:hypothetical protein
MMATAQDVADAVRRDLKDENDGLPVVTDDTLRRAIDCAVPEVADAILLAPAWASAAIILIPGTDAYELSPLYEYGEVVELRYASALLGLPGALSKVSREEMQRLRNVMAVPSRRPSAYSLEPQPDQHIRVVFDSKPASAENIDALVSILPTAWGVSETSPVIPFSTRALRALERKVAAEVGMALNSSDLTRLSINPSVFGVWAASAQSLIAMERSAVSRLRLDHGPTNLRWALEWRKT